MKKRMKVTFAVTNIITPKGGIWRI